MQHLDLFSGIGGFALAAQWAGFETVAFCEIEPYCQKVLRKNFGEDIVIHDDIKQLDGTRYTGAIDLLTGGFPCQPYSTAGKRKGDKDPRALWSEMRRVIHEAKPTWVVGENVANFANMALHIAKADLESEGYEVVPFSIPACGVGAPHQRQRIFVLAHTQCQGERGRGIQRRWKNHNTERKGASNRPCGTGEDGREQDDTNTALKGERQILLSARRPQYQDANAFRLRGNVPYSINNGLDRAQGNASEPRGDRSNHWLSVRDNNWTIEPNVGRVADGVPNRVDRLEGLGNALVPQQVYPILQGIADLLNQSRLVVA